MVYSTIGIRLQFLISQFLGGGGGGGGVLIVLYSLTLGMLCFQYQLKADVFYSIFTRFRHSSFHGLSYATPHSEKYVGNWGCFPSLS